MYLGANQSIIENFEINPETVLLVVRIKDSRPTDYFPSDVTKVCYGDDACIPWSYWYVHSAEVLEVVYGDYAGESVNFAILQHADFSEIVKEEFYVVLKEFATDEVKRKLSTEYFVENYSYNTTFQ